MRYKEIFLDNLMPSLGHNIVNCYIDKSSLLRNNIHDTFALNNKFVTYFIILPNDKYYIGYTHDFGQRVKTHLKDGRSSQRDLYVDMRNEGSFTVSLLGIYENEELAKESEKRELAELREEILKDSFGDYWRNVPQYELNQALSSKCYNKKDFLI